MPPVPDIEIGLDTARLKRQIAAFRLCLSQMGFALDNLLLTLEDSAQVDTDRLDELVIEYFDGGFLHSDQVAELRKIYRGRGD